MKGFQKISLAPGETKTVDFCITLKDLQFYDEATHAWKAEPGKFNASERSTSESQRDPETNKAFSPCVKGATAFQSVVSASANRCLPHIRSNIA